MPATRKRNVLPEITRLRRARLVDRVMAQTSAPGISRAERDLAVTGLRAYRLREPGSGRSYTVIKITTQSDLSGFGECGVASSEDVAKARQILIAMPATAYEVARQRLVSLPRLQAAVNMALLDLLGQFTHAPVYQLLGGPTRNKARAMAALQGHSDEALRAAMNRAREAGYRAFRVPVPRIAAPNQGQAFVRAAQGRLEALRAAGGEDLDFVLDAGGGLSPGDAASLAKAVEHLHLLWFDEPCPLSNLGVVPKIAAETVTPLGFGRHIHECGQFQNLLREEIVDVLRPDISWNGITQIRKVAALAETYYVAVAPYHDGGPIATAAALHLAASLPNFFIQQIPRPEAEADRRMRSELTGSSVEIVKDGFAVLTKGPGLGITVDEQALEKYRDRSG